MLIRCIAKVADSYKVDRKIQRSFQPYGAIAFDDRNLTWYTDKSAVSIWTLQGRQHIPFSAGEHQRSLLASRKGESDLVYHRGAFYLLAVCDVPEPDEQTVDGVLGVDLGMVNLATDSDSAVQRAIERKRRAYGIASRCHSAQKVRTPPPNVACAKGSHSAAFRKTPTTVIAKRLVQKANDTNRAIALEDLTHIRSRTTVRKSGRARHSNWAFRQLRAVHYLQGAVGWCAGALIDPSIYEPAVQRMWTY